MIEPMLACGAPAMLAISLVASAASAAVAYRGQKQQAASQRKYQQEIQEAENEAFLMEARSRNIKHQEEATARVQQGEQIRQRGLVKSSQAQLQISESGASGLTFTQAMNQYSADRSKLLHNLSEEQRMATAHHSRALDHLRFSALQRNIATNKPVSEPSAAGAILGFIGDNAYNTYAVGKKEGMWGGSSLGEVRGPDGIYEPAQGNAGTFYQLKG